MPNINGIWFKLESFKYDTSLNQKIVYYHMLLNENTSNLCTSIPPRGKSCSEHLPLRVSN